MTCCPMQDEKAMAVKVLKEMLASEFTSRFTGHSLKCGQLANPIKKPRVQ